MKIQSKITLLFFGLATVGLLLLNAAIFYFVSEFNFEDFFKRLEARVNLNAEIRLYPDSRSDAYREVRTKYLERLDDEKDYVIPVDTKRRTFKKPVDLPDDFYRTIIEKGKARYNVGNRFYAGSYFQTQTGPNMIMVGASDPYGFKELEQLKKVLVIGFVLSLVCIYVVGLIFSNYTMKPFRQIIRSVKNISADNLNLRLPEDGGKDELSELVLTFNHMLTRLETAFETQNNFVSNASHELRTPLAIISGETELLLMQKNLTEQSKASATAILKEADKLSQIIASLLGLAQSGFDGKNQKWQKIRVDELIMDVIGSVQKITPESSIELDYSNLPADEHLLYTSGILNLLHLSVTNIVMNGCKYSNNQPVQIALSSENGRINISVTDRGIGIPENELQYIFDPFFRASNTSDFEGYGIGLPLTLNIIRLHKGTIGIRSEVGKGTEIQLLLPVYGL